MLFFYYVDCKRLLIDGRQMIHSGPFLSVSPYLLALLILVPPYLCALLHMLNILRVLHFGDNLSVSVIFLLLAPRSGSLCPAELDGSVLD